MVDDTSRGITNIISREKYLQIYTGIYGHKSTFFNVTNNAQVDQVYQAMSTARVTRIGCCFQFAYLDSSVFSISLFFPALA